VDNGVLETIANATPILATHDANTILYLFFAAQSNAFCDVLRCAARAEVALFFWSV